jgi:hypothetical protein
MTNEEKQEIISSVIQSLQTNSATIDQLSAEIRGKLQKKHTLFAKKEKKGKEKKVHREKANKGNVLSTV